MREEPPPSLRDLDERLRKAREVQASNAAKLATTQNAVGYRVLVELLAGIIFGLGAGWLLDTWLGTRPWFLVGMLAIGFAAGFWNAVKTIWQIDKAARTRRPE